MKKHADERTPLGNDFCLVGDEDPDDAADVDGDDGEDEEGALLLDCQLKGQTCLTETVPKLCPQPPEKHAEAAKSC